MNQVELRIRNNTGARRYLLLGPSSLTSSAVLEAPSRARTRSSIPLSASLYKRRAANALALLEEGRVSAQPEPDVEVSVDRDVLWRGRRSV